MLKIYSLIFLAAMLVLGSADARAQTSGSSNPPFDKVLMMDFEKGMAGDKTLFDSAMGRTEAILAQNPNDARALAWHGSGTLYRLGMHERNKSKAESEATMKKGIKEMDDAVSAAPEDVLVLVVRAATLTSVAKHTPSSDESARLLTAGIGDFEKIARLTENKTDGESKGLRIYALKTLIQYYEKKGDAEKANAYKTLLSPITR